MEMSMQKIAEKILKVEKSTWIKYIPFSTSIIQCISYIFKEEAFYTKSCIAYERMVRYRIMKE